MATNGANNIPTGANGTILQGKGVGTNCAFTTATYPSTAGTSGNVLMSDGTNWVSVPTMNANSVITFVDDMLYSYTATSLTNSSALFGHWLGSAVGTQASITPNYYSDNGHPGVFFITTGTTNAGHSQLIISDNSGFSPFVFGGGQLTATFYFYLPQLSSVTDRFSLQIGMCDNTTTYLGENGCYFTYSDNVNSGNWVCVCNKSTVKTSSNTSTAASVNWWVGQIVVNAAATSVDFKLGNTLSGLTTVATIATNIPVLYSGPAFTITKSIGTTEVGIAPDLVTISQTLTTAR